MRYIPILATALLALAACSQAPAPSQEAAPAAKAAPAPLTIAAPSGTYKVDRNHADLSFRLKHLGLADYVARFHDYSMVVELDSENLSASSVRLEIDPTSVRTGYAGDYKATHKDSAYETWEEDLAQSERFFNAGQFPKIVFQSSSVSQMDDHLMVSGDLTMLGKTLPVTMAVYIVGAKAEHPMTRKGAFGVSARGSFQRSPFGMDFLVKQGLLGDTVTVVFDGEFHQVDAPPAE